MTQMGDRTRRGFEQAPGVVLAGLLLVIASGCGGSGTPTALAATDLVVSDAKVLVDGESVGGLTLPMGHGDGAVTRFEAQLMADGAPTPGQVMWLEFDRPRAMGMGHHTGRIPLFDDGTHGDLVAGDGLYCYEDMAEEYGCHGAGAGAGEYHYEFYGLHAGGHESGHVTVTVTIAGP